MPYRDAKRYRDYMREYMKKQRRLEQEAKQRIFKDIESMERLRRNFPAAYELLFGKKRRK